MFGVGSGALQYIGYELRLLFWIETWGPGPAWGIRGALVVLGLLFVALGLTQRSSTGQSSVAFGGPPGWTPGQPGVGPQGQQPGVGPQGPPAQPGQPWVALEDGTVVIPGPDGVGLQFTPKTPGPGQPPSTPFG
ncbi:hypothetical protein BH23ACT9_BH23ACT9_13050 [soil metagenome]